MLLLDYSDDTWRSLRSIGVPGEVMLTNARDARYCLMSAFLLYFLICMAYRLNCCDSNWHLCFCLLGIMMTLLMNRNDALCPSVVMADHSYQEHYVPAHLPFKRTLFFQVSY